MSDDLFAFGAWLLIVAGLLLLEPLYTRICIWREERHERKRLIQPRAD